MPLGLAAFHKNNDALYSLFCEYSAKCPYAPLEDKTKFYMHLNFKQQASCPKLYFEVAPSKRLTKENTKISCSWFIVFI